MNTKGGAIIRGPGHESMGPGLHETTKKNNKVIYGGRDIGISGVSAIVKRLTLNEDIPVIIQADEGASHGVFSRVYGEAKLAGAKSINFSTKR